MAAPGPSDLTQAMDIRKAGLCLQLDGSSPMTRLLGTQHVADGAELSGIGCQHCKDVFIL